MTLHSRICLLLNLLLIPLSPAAEEGFFIAVGGLDLVGEDGEPLHDAEGHLVGESAIGTVSISENGRDWEIVYSGGPIKDGFTHARNNMVRSLAFGNGVLVAALNGGSTLTSRDGRHWEEHPRGDDQPGPNSMNLVFGRDGFVSGSAGEFAHSQDGIQWKAFPTAEQIWNINGVGVWDGAGHVRRTLYNKGVYVIWGESRFGTSPDAIHLNLDHHILSKDEKWDRGELISAQGKFIWMGGKAFPDLGIPAEHASSTDGKTWTPFLIESDSAEVIQSQQNIIWTGTRFVVSGPDCVYHSTDLKYWKRISCSSPHFAKGMNCGYGDLLIASQGWARQFAVSIDGGATWEEVPFPEGLGCRQIYCWTGSELLGSKEG